MYLLIFNGLLISQTLEYHRLSNLPYRIIHKVRYAHQSNQPSSSSIRQHLEVVHRGTWHQNVYYPKFSDVKVGVPHLSDTYSLVMFIYEV
jgi:hypothetical protein